MRRSALHLLLDDLPGGSLVAGWAWSRWLYNWHELMRSSPTRSTAGRNGRMEVVCTGFAPGSSALMDSGESAYSRQSYAEVGTLVNPADPQGWHSLAEQPGVGMRRARRMDLRLAGERLYNDWAWTFLDGIRNTLVPAALIPLAHIDDAYTELKRVIAMGYKAMMMAPAGFDSIQKYDDAACRAVQS